MPTDAPAVSGGRPLLRIPEVLARVPLSRASIYAAMKRGAFPRPVRLSLRAVAWREQDIATWLAERAPAQGVQQ